MPNYLEQDQFLEQQNENIDLDIIEREKERIEKEIQRINQQLEKREDIYNQQIEEIKDQIRRLKDQRDSVPQNRIKRINHIERVIADLKKEKRDRLQQKWNDKQPLLRKRRELKKEKDAMDDPI